MYIKYILSTNSTFSYSLIGTSSSLNTNSNLNTNTNSNLNLNTNLISLNSSIINN